MKIVALLPFKNEAQFLGAYCSSLTGIVDAIVAIDDGSTDNSSEVLREKSPVPVCIENSDSTEDWSVDKIRQQLLDAGRDVGGTHFVCLDADEAFTGQFKNRAKEIMARLEPGQKIQMQWLAMWKSVTHYRDDTSVWSNNYKDFIFFDKKGQDYSSAYLCEPRTPGPSNENTLLKLNSKYGAVFHYQFSDFDNFQMKQAWYRCRELVSGKKILDINQKYSITLDEPNVFVRPAEEEWKDGINFPMVTYRKNSKDTWHYHEIIRLFDEHGIKSFYPLKIWHIPELMKRRLQHG